MLKVVPLRYGTAFKKAFSDSEVFSKFASDVLGLPIEVDTVQREYRYPEAVGRVNVEYDLFAEDVKHRVIVEVQHIRETDFFERFLHYHLVGVVEQPLTFEHYRTSRTVCTVVVLTTEPRDTKARFSVAVSDMDPVNEQGTRLGVYRHKLVFLNPKIINDQTPPAARRWMELIADSLDGEVEAARYPDPVLQRVIGAIGKKSLSPDELARIIDEKAWEETKRDAIVDSLRDVLVRQLRGSGIALDARDVARIEACDDPATLDRWLMRVPGAKRTGDVFG
jgi:hypothetical protein